MSKPTDNQLNFLIRNMAQRHQAELPSPGLIWWRAQIQKKLAAKERIERPMMIMRVLVWAVCLMAFVAIVAWKWGDIAPGAASGSTGLFLAIAVFSGIALIVPGWFMLQPRRKG